MAVCRGCGAKIFWLRTAGRGKLMPIDSRPVRGGNLEVSPDRLVHVVAPDANVTRYVSHYATCPKAKEHRNNDRTGREVDGTEDGDPFGTDRPGDVAAGVPGGGDPRRAGAAQLRTPPGVREAPAGGGGGDARERGSHE